MLSLHRTTLAFVAQRTHQDVRHIARSITYRCTTVAYWRFKTCVLSYEHFFHANIHKTACEFLHSHDILVASARATIVKAALQYYITHLPMSVVDPLFHLSNFYSCLSAIHYKTTKYILDYMLKGSPTTKSTEFYFQCHFSLVELKFI